VPRSLLGCCSPRSYPGLVTASARSISGLLYVDPGSANSISGETRSWRNPTASRRGSSCKQGPRCPGLSALRPIQYRDSLCVDLGMLPVSEGITAPPFISRAFAFCIPELISRRLIRVDVPLNHTWDFKCHLQADRVLKSWFSMVLQALCIQSPGSAWAHPTREDPDPTPGSWSSIL
jgi:hypothetical protein